MLGLFLFSHGALTKTMSSDLEFISGLSLVAVGLALERILVRYVCSECRNRVEKESKLCPSCRCLLQRKGMSFGSILLISLAITAVSIALFMWAVGASLHLPSSLNGNQH